MVAELAPGHDLEELVEGAVSAGKSEEAVRGVRHARLALVHRVDDVELREPEVRDLARREAGGNDAVRDSALLEDGVREDAHEADPAAAEHEAGSGARDLAADGGGLLGVGRRDAGARPAEDGEHRAVEGRGHRADDARSRAAC